MFVVTGGGSGIGKALAQTLALRDKRVLIVGRREPQLADTAEDYSQIDWLSADISTEKGRQLVIEALETVPVIEGLVHNAGIIDPISPMINIKESAWRQIMATNVEAPLFLTQALSEKLINGRVLNIGSGAAYFPVAGWAPYCVSKAALAMLTRCWQLECHEIAFANVMPGIIDTPMQALIRHAQAMHSEKREFFRELKQQSQLVSSNTVALFLCWLLLDIDKEEYRSQEWDIYDTSHHTAWLVSPHVVPTLE